MFSETQLFLILSGLFFAALVFALLLNSLFMRFARTLGIRDQHGLMERWSASAKPAFGGITFFIIFLGCFALHGVFFPNLLGSALQPELLGLIAATALGFLMGLSDDAYNTRPILKFLVQVACGATLIASGTSIEIFTVTWINQLFTVLWVVGMMNSINMLDNMDGITTMVSIMILVSALVVLVVRGPIESVHMVLIVGTIAALAGFLFFNWHPSRMFMGDTGSQFLGVFLAFVGIRFFWNTTSPMGEVEPARQVVAALIAFLLPIIDTTTVTLNRIGRGTSPFVGGRDHTTHHLSYAGLSDSQVALVFTGLSAVSVFLTFVIVRFIPVWENLHTIIFVSYAILLFGTLFALTHRKQRT